MSNPSPGALAQLFELVGSRGLRLVADKALGPGLFTELPPADEADSVRYAVVQGGEGVADQEYLCRKNADGTFGWVPKTISETTLLLLSLQSTDEASNPQNLFPIEPSVVAQTLNLNKFSQARFRSRVTGPGTSGVTGTLEYSTDAGGSWATLLTSTIDFSQAAQTTEWEDIPAGALGAETFVGMRVVMAGAGTATPILTLILDVRG